MHWGKGGCAHQQHVFKEWKQWGADDTCRFKCFVPELEMQVLVHHIKLGSSKESRAELLGDVEHKGCENQLKWLQFSLLHENWQIRHSVGVGQAAYHEDTFFIVFIAITLHTWILSSRICQRGVRNGLKLSLAEHHPGLCVGTWEEWVQGWNRSGCGLCPTSAVWAAVRIAACNCGGGF